MARQWVMMDTLLYTCPQIKNVPIAARNKKMQTPCEKICVMENGYCLGCNRTQEEIANWSNYTDNERERIMEELFDREV
jgi:predicted Fe-S protein YdhL (DUF1289 family)